MTPRGAGRIARQFGVMLYDGDAAPLAARWCSALVTVEGAAVVMHRRDDTPAELRERCRWASKRAKARA